MAKSLQMNKQLRFLLIFSVFSLISFAQTNSTGTDANKKQTGKSPEKMKIGKYDHVSCSDQCSIVFIDDSGKEFSAICEGDGVSGFILHYDEEVNKDILGMKFKVWYTKKKCKEGGFDQDVITKVEIIK